MQELEHSPTLNTVIMVERTLKNMGESAITVSELKRRLPKQEGGVEEPNKARAFNH